MQVVIPCYCQGTNKKCPICTAIKNLHTCNCIYHLFLNKCKQWQYYHKYLQSSYLKNQQSLIIEHTNIYIFLINMLNLDMGGNSK